MVEDVDSCGQMIENLSIAVITTLNWGTDRGASISCLVKIPSLSEKIQHGCLNSEQPSCFSCLIILGHNIKKTWATAKKKLIRL